MKTFSIILALLCCFTFSFAQLSNPIQLKGSWEISTIEAKDIKKTIFKHYLGQKIHFLEDKKLILETDDGYYFASYAYNYSKLIFATYTYEVSINSEGQLILDINIERKYNPYQARYTLTPTATIDTNLSSNFNKLAATENISEISNQGFYYRFDDNERKNVYLRFLADSTLIRVVDKKSPADIYHKLNQVYHPTMPIAFPAETVSAIHTEKYKHRKRDNAIVLAYNESHYQMQDGQLTEKRLKYTVEKDTLNTQSYSYQYIPTNKLGYWFDKEQDTTSTKKEKVRHILMPPLAPPTTSASTSTSTSTIKETFKVVEEMPRFPGCEHVPAAERKACADKSMLEYIYQNVVYPKEAEKNKTEGIAVVQFVVEKDGSLSDVKVVRDPGDGIGAAAADVVNKMIKDDIRWMPGKQRGTPVRVMFNLPVKFRLE